MKPLLILILLAGIFLSATTLTIAQSTSTSEPKMPMHDTMPIKSKMTHENMQSMGQLMVRMGNTFENHKMSSDQHKECARFMRDLSTLMMRIASDVELKDVETHKNKIKEITKEWNYFESEDFEDH